MIWRKVGKMISAEGTDITYQAILHGENLNLYIESRKRHIPHANGIGTWDHTSYFVTQDNELVEKMSLRDAKESAESLINGAE